MVTNFEIEGLAGLFLLFGMGLGLEAILRALRAINTQLAVIIRHHPEIARGERDEIDDEIRYRAARREEAARERA